MPAIALLLLAWATAPPAAGQGYAGSAACRPCHAAQHRLHSMSGHAAALHRAKDHPMGSRFAGEPVAREPFRLTWRDYRSQVDDGEPDQADWAFGSGRQGVTFVARENATTFLELPLSFYSRTGRFDLTPGHEALRPRTAEEARGQRFRASPPGFSITRCFECHSTGPVRIDADSVSVAESGVRCEACHGAAGAHAANPSVRGGIRSRKGLDGDEMNALCGTCHRAPGGEHSNDFSNPWNVRHQPPYLEQSRCFQASAGKLTCLTCHDPHAGLAGSKLESSNARCGTCHATKPANCRADCVSCHMPAVKVGKHLQFRNHWIGVYRAESSPALIPAR
jgi:hypothetical protein